jgi:hypothetical protein
MRVRYRTLAAMRPVFAAFALAFVAAAPAVANNEIRSVEADAYGNAVIRTVGGAKIIAVGQAALAADFAANRSAEPTVIGVEPVCREIGIILKGRSHMYGVSDGDPVPLATKVVCQ